MAILNSTIIIDSDVQTVFNYMTDPDNNNQWQSTFRSCKQTNGDDMEIGTTYRYINTFLGINMQTNGMITEYEDNHVLAFEFNSSMVSGSSRLVVEEKGLKTKVSVAGEVDLKFVKFGKKIAEMKAKRPLKSDLNKLKKMLESGG